MAYKQQKYLNSSGDWKPEIKALAESSSWFINGHLVTKSSLGRGDKGAFWGLTRAVIPS